MSVLFEVRISLGRHLPRIGGSRDEHRARRGAGAAVLQERVGDRGRATGALHAERQVLVAASRRTARTRCAPAPSRRRARRRRARRGRSCCPGPSRDACRSTVTRLSVPTRMNAFGASGPVAAPSAPSSAASAAVGDSQPKPMTRPVAPALCRNTRRDTAAARRCRRRRAASMRRRCSSAWRRFISGCMARLRQPASCADAAWIAARMRW